jgi:hypothetical protein
MGFPDIVNLAQNPTELLERYGLAPARINDIVIDVLKVEMPSYEFDITEHPVEDGTPVSDMKIKRPPILILDTIFADAEFDAVGIITKFIGTGSPSFLSTWQDKQSAIYELMNSDEKRITVTTEHYIYQDMLLKAVRPIREVDKVRAWFVQLEFKNVRIVQNETSEALASELPEEVKNDPPKAKEATDSKKKQAKKSNRGKQQTKEATKPQKSVLRQMAEGLGINYG